MNNRKEKLQALLEKIEKSEPASLEKFFQETEVELLTIINTNEESLSQEEEKIFWKISEESGWKYYYFIDKWEDDKFQPNQQEKMILENFYHMIEEIAENADKYEASEGFKNLKEEKKIIFQKKIEKAKKYQPILQKLLEKSKLLSSSSETPSSSNDLTANQVVPAKGKDKKKSSFWKIFIPLSLVAIVGLGLIVFLVNKKLKAKQVKAKTNKKRD